MRALSSLALLACLPAAAALHVEPVRAGNAMRLRGGKGLIGMDNLNKLSLGLTLSQGSVMAFAPDKVLQLYGAAPALSKEDETWEQSLSEMTGANVLCSLITMIAFTTGQPLHQAVAYGLAGVAAYTVKWGYTEAPKFKQPTAPVYGWAVVEALMALLMYKGGGGLVESRLLLKAWVCVMAATALPFYFAPDLIFKTYKVKAPGARSMHLVEGMMTFQLSIAAFILGGLCPRAQPAPAWGGWWSVLFLSILRGVVNGDYKEFRMPNGYPMVAWAILAAALAFEANSS